MKDAFSAGNAGADVAIWISMELLAGMIAWMYRTRHDQPFIMKSVMALTGTSLGLIGWTHCLDVVAIWWSVPLTSTIVRMSAALTSMLTALCVVSWAGVLATIPTPSELSSIRRSLRETEDLLLHYRSLDVGASIPLADAPPGAEEDLP